MFFQFDGCFGSMQVALALCHKVSIGASDFQMSAAALQRYLRFTSIVQLLCQERRRCYFCTQPRNYCKILTWQMHGIWR